MMSSVLPFPRFLGLSIILVLLDASRSAAVPYSHLDPHGSIGVKAGPYSQLSSDTAESVQRGGEE